MDLQLYNAVRCDDENFIRELQSSNKKTLFKVTSQGDTILHAAARFRQTEIAKLILEWHPSLVCQKNFHGDTPLHIAARIGDSDMVHLLVSYKVAELDQEVDEADEKLVQIVNMKEETALHDAVRGDHLEVVKQLIEKDPLLPTLPTGGGESPLFLAVERMHIQVAAHILSHAESFSFQGRNNMNALHAAIIRGCNLDNEGNSSLHLATLDGNFEIVELLMHDGRVDKTAINNKGVAFMDIQLSMKEDPQLPFKVIEHGDARRLASLERVTNEGNKQGILSVNEVEQTKKIREQVQERCGKPFKNNTPAVRDNEDDKEVGQNEDDKEVVHNEDDEEVKDAKELADDNVIVATLIAGVSFAAAVSMPGGYKSDGREAGMAILGHNASFKAFVVANSLAFAFSFGSLFSHFLTFKGRDMVGTAFIRFQILCSVLCLLVAFIAGSYAVLADSRALSISSAVLTSIYFCTGIRIFSAQIRELWILCN